MGVYPVENYKRTRRPFCDCGKKTATMQAGAWVCQPCHDTQSIYDGITTKRENDLRGTAQTEEERLGKKNPDRLRRESIYCEPYTVTLPRFS
jgi:hypothetical protein